MRAAAVTVLNSDAASLTRMPTNGLGDESHLAICCPDGHTRTQLCTATGLTTFLNINGNWNMDISFPQYTQLYHYSKHCCCR